MTVFLQFLGGAAILRDGRAVTGPPAQRHRLALLAVLAAAEGRPVTRDRLLALLWPEHETGAARRLLNLAVHVVRGLEGAGAIASAGDALALDPSLLPSDLAGFTRAVAGRRPADAVAAYGGAFLDGFHLPRAEEFDRWAEGIRARLSREFGQALEAVAGEALGRGDQTAAIEARRRGSAHQPLDAAAAIRLIELLAATGDRAGALRAAEEYRRGLHAELDLEPEPALAALEQRIRGAGRPSPSPGRVRRTRVEPELDDSEAARHCLRGRFFWGRRDRASLEKALGAFQTALRADPTHAPAYAGLADTHSMLGFYDYLAPRDAFSRARSAARRALALAPGRGEPLVSAGYVRMYYDWSWSDAESAFRQAVEAAPRYPVAHQWYGNYLSLRGRFDEAMAAMRRSRALAPVSPIACAACGWTHYHAGRHEEALDYLHESLELEPHFAVGHLWLGMVYEELARWDEAVASLARAQTLLPESATAAAALARTRARAGSPDDAREALERLGRPARRTYLPAYDIAKVHLGLGDRAAGFRWLGRAVRQRSHSIAFLRVDPQLARERDHPWFSALLQDVGLA